jgi:N5-hydroxy-L-ornithine N5-transacylase
MKASTKSPLAAGAVAKLRLPYPYYTTYYAVPSDEAPGGQNSVQLKKDDHEASKADAEALEEELHNDSLYYTPLRKPQGNLPPDSNNSAWARARRSYHTSFEWTCGSAPTLGQAWLVVYAILTQSPDHEYFRLSLHGPDSGKLRDTLMASTLAIAHPSPDNDRLESTSSEGSTELLVLRSTFWQGAGSPIGRCSAWVPLGGGSSNTTTTDHVMTTKFPETRVHRFHPRRAPKPKPGSVIYSRYIPALDEHFSMIALDYENPEHLSMFHNWQNDPRVAKGWNETGDLDHHRTYLRNLHEDPHVLTVLARFEDICFAYFEIYWAKVTLRIPSLSLLQASSN